MLTLRTVVAASILAACALPPADAEEIPWPFPIRVEHRPGTYWWCPGSALTEADIDWNLQKMREGGIGTAHIVPIYGAKGAEDRYLPFLSPRWMKMLDHAVRKAKSLGMQVDMTTGTGWCFGGPDLPKEAIDLRVRYDAKKEALSTQPGRKVKRAAPGGEGYMLNPFSPDAMRLYLERFDRAFDASKAALPRAQYHDSFEYAGDWSVALLDEFKKRRGYELREHLGTFFGKTTDANRETKSRVKTDYRATLAELHFETMRVWNDWAKKRGMLTRNEAHGGPANLLDVYALSDIPETEMFGAPDYPIPGFRRDPKMVRKGDSDPRICMTAASAAHVAHAPGRQLVSSESCTWLREHWHTSLAHVKLEMDDFFLVGVNHAFFHGTCFSPKDAPWPGWFFYASTKFDWRNAFWRDIGFLNGYIARCQAVLQAGEPGNDVLLYWPLWDYWASPDGSALRMTVHGSSWMSGQRVGEVANALTGKGYVFDLVSDRMLETIRVEDGRIRAPGGTYRVVVVPSCRHMPVATLRRLADLAAKGALVVFEKALPPDVPGLADLEKRRAELAAVRKQLEGVKTATVAGDAVAGLARAGVPREERLAAAGLRFIRRRVDGDTWYFVANQGAKAHHGWTGLAAPCAAVVRHDPLTGASGTLALRDGETGKEAYLQLVPGGSVVLHARQKPDAAPAWTYLEPAGEPAALTGTWKVEFIAGEPAKPDSHTLTELASWTKAPDKKAEAFAGTACYTLTFEKPGTAADDWILDLGDVRESARVRINGEEAGALFCIPFRTRVGRLLKPGKNTLEVEVTNLSANRIRDLERRKVDWKIMKDINIVNVWYKKFDPAQWPLAESGLLGPVTLRPMKRNTPGR